MFAKKSSGLKYASLDDLKDKSVGVVIDYAYTPEFWASIKKSSTVESVVTDEQNFKKLASDRVQFVVCEYAVGLSILKKLGSDKDIVAFPDTPIKSTGLYYMFSKKSVKQDFVEKFSASLKEFKASPEYSKLYHKYF
jgi:ABC-type amino acid transport substrate-binding protein